MTIDKSLKVRRGMARARSVFTRAERLERLKAADRWKEGDDVLGLPKVRVPKLALKKKKKEKKEGEEGAAPAAGGKAAAGGKPAAGAKPAAAAKPAAKGGKK